MKLQVTTFVCVLALMGCTDQVARARLGIVDPTVLKSGVGVSQDEAAGAVNPQWIATYAPIRSSRDILASLQQRLDHSSINKRVYLHAKAQCWLDAAREARQEDNRWGFVEEAIGQAAVITMSLEHDEPQSAVSPALRTVSTVRPDLWKIADTIKADQAFAQCPKAQPHLACAEVELMRAGHDAWRRSFSAAEKRLSHVQDQLRTSAETALQCKQAKRTSASTPQPNLAWTPNETQKLTLRADSSFTPDRDDEGFMLPAAQQQLNALLDALKSAPAVRELRVIGHADRLGNKAYNQSLSVRRAQTVERYLQTHGLTLPVTVQGWGSTRPLVGCRQVKRSDLVKCLAPNRRVEIQFVTSAS